MYYGIIELAPSTITLCPEKYHESGPAKNAITGAISFSGSPKRPLQSTGGSRLSWSLTSSQDRCLAEDFGLHENTENFGF